MSDRFDESCEEFFSDPEKVEEFREFFDNYLERERAEEGYAQGGPRRCRVHPNVRTSSDDGMHDAPCGQCEHESYMQDDADAVRATDDDWRVESSRQLMAYEADEDDIPF